MQQIKTKNTRLGTDVGYDFFANERKSIQYFLDILYLESTLSKNLFKHSTSFSKKRVLDPFLLAISSMRS